MITAPLFSLMFMVLGNGFFMSFISLHMEDKDIPYFIIGLTHSAYYFGVLFSSLYANRLISRIGHVRSLTATCGLMTACSIILYAIPEPLWFLFRLVAGLCVGCFFVAVESWLLTVYSRARRGFALGVYSAVQYFSLAVSQLFLLSSESNSTLAFVFIGACVGLAAVPVSVSVVGGPKPIAYEPHSILKFLKLSPLGVAGTLLSGMMFSSLMAFMPLYIEDRDFTPGLLMTCLVLGGGILQWPIGKASDYFDRRKVLIALGFCSIFLSAVLLTLPGMWAFTILLFLLGGACFAVYPVSAVLGCDCVEDKDIVKITGVFMFCYGLGSLIGPMLTSSLIYLTSHYLLWNMGAYGICLASVGLYAYFTLEPVDPELKSQFDMVPPTSILEEGDTKLRNTKF